MIVFFREPPAKDLNSLPGQTHTVDLNTQPLPEKGQRFSILRPVGSAGGTTDKKYFVGDVVWSLLVDEHKNVTYGPTIYLVEDAP